MKTEIKEISKMPAFLLIMFFIQLIVFFYYFIKIKSQDLEIFYILIPVTLLLVFVKMTIVLNSRSFKYKLFPIHFKFKEIEWNEISHVQISKINALSDFFGWGLRYSRKYGWGYIFNSNDAILLTLKNDKKITITVKDRTEIIKFLTENKIPFSI